MTNQVKYDRNKDRQGLFKEDFFKTSYSENLQLLQEWIEESKSDSTIPSDALPQQLYLTMLTEYTAGFPIEEIKKRMNQIVYYCKQCLDIHRQYGQKEDIMFIWGPEEWAGEEQPNIIGLCLLFERMDWLETIKDSLNPYNDDEMYYDPSFRALMNMALPTKFDPSAKFAKGGHNFRKPLLQAIMAESKEESLKYLNAYLAGWYEGNRKIGNLLIDTHLNQDPEYGGYIGYWSFESAAVAYLKDLDDTPLRKYLYYPRDMVDWAREQKLKREQEQDRSGNLPLLLNAGTPAPFSGRYGTDNFIGHEIQIKQGELLPAGQVSAKRDKNGNPIFREDTVWRLLKREDKGKVRFSEKEVEELQK